MSDELALRIPITADTSSMSRAMDDMKSKVSNSMGQMKDAMGAVGLATVGYLAGAISSATKAQESTDALTTKLKNQGDTAGQAKEGINAFTSGVEKMSIYSKGDAKAALDTLITRHVSLKEALKDQTGITELASAKNITLKEAADQVANAENGRMGGLVKLGVVTKEEVKNGISMDEVNKRLNSSYKGIAEGKMKDLPGQIALMHRSFSDFTTSIGLILLPTITKLGSVFGDIASKIDNIDAPTKKIIAGVLVATAVFGTLIGGLGVAQKVMGILSPAIKGVGLALEGMVWPVMAVIAVISLFTVVYTKNFGGFKTFVNNVFGSVVSLFNAFKAAISGGDVGSPLAKAFGKNTASIKVVIQGIVDVVKVFIDVLTGNMKKAESVLDSWGGDSDERMRGFILTVGKVAIVIKDVVGTAISDLKIVVDWVTSHLPTMQQIFNDVMAGIKVIWETILKPVLDLIVAAFLAVVNWVKDNWKTIQDIFKSVFDGIVTIYNSILKPLLAFAIDGFKSVVDWVKTNWHEISDTIKTVFDLVTSIIKIALEVVLGVVKDAMAILEPVWQAAWNIIKDVVPPIFKLIEDGIGAAIKVIGDVIKVAMDIVNVHWGDAWKSICKLAKDIFGGMGKIVNDELDIVGGIFNAIVTTAIGWGKDMIGGIITGIKGAIGDIESAVGDVVDAVTNKFKELFGIHSPSKVMQDIGGFLTSGLIKGLSASDIGSHVSGLISGMKGDFAAVKDFFNNVGAGSGMSAAVVGQIKQAMSMLNIPMQYLPGLETIAMNESTGDVNSINLWDSNAKAGHPSQGLFQTIPSTFAEFKVSGHDNINNGLDNSLAAIRYMISRYGSISNVPGLKALSAGQRYQGYAMGTFHSDQGLAWTGENGPELSWKNSGTGILDSVNSKALLNIPGVLQNLTNEIKNMSNGNSKGNGVTQYIEVNSPTALTPSETGRQVKRATQQLAMQW